jgi:hypothetical protein
MRESQGDVDCWQDTDGIQDVVIKEEQKIQLQSEKGQKNKQRSTKHYRQLKSEQRELHWKPDVNSGAPEG